jgi:hypothetical protein
MSDPGDGACITRRFLICPIADMRNPLRLLALLFAALIPSVGWSQATVSSVSPRTCRPGETTTVVLTGTNLAAGFRAEASNVGATVEVVAAEAERAELKITLQSEADFGPFGLFVATDQGPVETQVLIADDLPSVVDNGANHSLEKAQEIPAAIAVDGTSDGGQSDFYRFTVTAGQRVAFEVVTQQIGSTMDPMLRLIDESGATLREMDDDAVGPEPHFDHVFEQPGTYWLQITDSRYAAGGGYHLRVGDFPILAHAYPLTAARGEVTSIGFVHSGSAAAQRVDFSCESGELARSRMVATKRLDGQYSAWTTIRLADRAAVVQPQPNDMVAASEPVEDPASWQPPTMTIPVEINGVLAVPQEIDSFPIRGAAGKTVRFQAHTRSLGCGTLLRMKLLNSAGATVAETAVADTDQWSFDYAFPDDAEYTLQVTDLIGRGGAGFGYAIEVVPTGTFRVALKADAATAERFAVEPVHGAVALDLQVDRLGYEGPIELSLVDAPGDFRLLGATIPAGAKAARVHLQSSAGWQPSGLRSIRLAAQAQGDPTTRCLVDSLELHRLKQPEIPFPAAWNNGRILLAGAEPRDPFFKIPADKPLPLARPITTHSTALAIERLNAEFKTPVQILSDSLPAGWTMQVANEADTYTATMNRSADAAEAESLQLLVYGEFQGRGRIETVTLPIGWIEPVSVSLQNDRPLVPGTTAQIQVRVVRTGDDPQAVSLQIANPPEGLTLASPCEIPADVTEGVLHIAVAPEFAATGPVTFDLEMTSKYHDQEFKTLRPSGPIEVMTPPTSLAVYPDEISLQNAKQRRQIVVTGTAADQSIRDWTRQCAIVSRNPEVAEVRNGVVYPRGNGTTEIAIRVGTLETVIPVGVAGFETVAPTQFESEVLVSLSKQGCNSGACHGSPSGKGMFRLSLRAFDQQLDQLTLIREDFGRRINRIEPEKSLLLLKPMMKVSHGGGKQLHEGDHAYQVLLDWISEGAGADPPNTARCDRLEVFPNEKRIMNLADGGQQLAVVAHFTDGSIRDVTHTVAYESSDTSVATVDADGLVTPHARGEAAILVRFLEHIESTEIMFVEEVPNFVWDAPEPANYIDHLTNQKLRQLKYVPAPTCTDSEFLRRAHLDLIGILPTVQETTDFLADADPEKRSKLVDRLLERDEFAKFWALKWGDYLKMTGKLIGDQGVYKYHRWVENAFAENMPYDEFARQLITAGGSTLANPAANFYRASTDMNECVETVSQVFLGARLQCAKCHNHPFERWTQDNYYGLGAFFNRVTRRGTQRPGEMFIWFAPTGDVTQPRTGETMKPWLPQRGSVEMPGPEDRRDLFAQWLTEADNPFFARIEANRIWSQLFSRGIVDPIDDFRDSNPPSNASLLDALAQDFVASGYDRKHLLRVIMASRTYQASFVTNELNAADTKYFSHQQPRLLGAEQLLDAVNHLTGVDQSFGKLPPGTKATHLPAPDVVQVEFLKVFGQPERSTVCACERADDSNLGMAIELFNGNTIHQKLRDPNNRFRKALADGQPIDKVIGELYLAALCRPPSEAELATAMTHCESREDKAAAVEDVYWALMNTDEFLFQH